MPLSNREKQAAHRQRQAERGVVSLRVDLPRELADILVQEAKARSVSRAQVALERLARKPPSAPPEQPLPADVRAIESELVALIGKGLRFCTASTGDREAATTALDLALDKVGALAAAARPARRKKR